MLTNFHHRQNQRTRRKILVQSCVNGLVCSACDVGRLGQQTHHDVAVQDTLFPHAQYPRFSETIEMAGSYVHFVRIKYCTKKLFFNRPENSKQLQICFISIYGLSVLEFFLIHVISDNFKYKKIICEILQTENYRYLQINL